MTKKTGSSEAGSLSERDEASRTKDMKKISVFFQGIGYNSDRPLLYYSRKLAVRHGYDTEDVRFGNIDKSVLKSLKDAPEVFDAAIRQAGEILDGLDLMRYEDIVFVSKSIGTVAAAAYAKKRGLKVRQVFFTPLEKTFSFTQDSNGIVFFGTGDPFISAGKVEELCRTNHLKYRIFEGANHSLETGDVAADISNLADVMKDVEMMFKP